MPAQNFRPITFTGTATTTAAKVSLNKKGHGLKLKNLGAHDLLISFNGSSDFYTIAKDEPAFNMDGDFFYFWIKSGAATVDYCATALTG